MWPAAQHCRSPGDDLISVVGDCNGDGVVDLNDLSCACSGGLGEVLTVLDLQTGDFDGDGLVGFTDFLQLSVAI